MGRFRYIHEDDQDDDENDKEANDGDGHHWEFVAETANKGAMVPRNGATEEAAPPFLARSSRKRQPRDSSSSSLYATTAQSEWLGEYSRDPKDTTRRKTRWWFWILLAAMLIQVMVVKTSPPAPPRLTTNQEPDTTWHDFLTLHVAQLQESVTALAYHTPAHIGKWWILGFVADVQHFYQTWYAARNHLQVPPACPLAISKNDNNKYALLLLNELVVGQESALDMVTDAIHAWDPQHAPLLLYLAGMPHVGQSTLARQWLPTQLFAGSDSNGENQCSARSLVAAVSVIDAHVLLDSTLFRHMDETSIQMQLAQRIMTHVQRLQQEGGIVILRHVDRLPPLVAAWLCRELGQEVAPPNTAFAAGDTPPPTLEPFALSLGLREQCRKFVFVFVSSSVGTRSIMTNIRTYGGLDNIPRASLALDMMHEMDAYFGPNVAKRFHAVAPFFPLGQLELAEILRRKIAAVSLSQATSTISLWSHLVITDAAVDALLDPAQVEYLSWKNRDDAESRSVLTFSSAGANVLRDGGPIMNKLQSKITACFVNHPTATRDIRRVAVIDHGGLQQGKIVMQWCSTSSSNDHAGDTPASEVRFQEPCEVTCRFSP